MNPLDLVRSFSFEIGIIGYDIGDESRQGKFLDLLDNSPRLPKGQVHSLGPCRVVDPLAGKQFSDGVDLNLGVLVPHRRVIESGRRNLSPELRHGEGSAQKII